MTDYDKVLNDVLRNIVEIDKDMQDDRNDEKWSVDSISEILSAMSQNEYMICTYGAYLRFNFEVEGHMELHIPGRGVFGAFSHEFIREYDEKGDADFDYE